LASSDLKAIERHVLNVCRDHLVIYLIPIV
jgi:hypothetical protein